MFNFDEYDGLYDDVGSMFNFDVYDGLYDDDVFVGPQPTTTQANGSMFNFDSPDGQYTDDYSYDYSTDVVGPHPTNIQGTLIDTSYLRPGDEGYGWQYYSDGTVISPDNKYYQEGQLVWEPPGQLQQAFQSLLGTVTKMGGAAGTQLRRLIVGDNGNVNWRNVAGLAGGLYGLAQSNRPQEKLGYQGGIPQYTALRAAVPQDAGGQDAGAQDVQTPEGGVDFASSGAPELGAVLRPDGSNYIANYTPPATTSARRPGSGGQRYFTDVQYAAPGDPSARSAMLQQLAQLQGGSSAAPQPQQQQQSEPEPAPEPQTLAAGGIASLAKGGAPRYLNGATDGMEDKIRANIDGKQEARLSHGEFVVPADVVGHLGNGNSEAGAKRLYDMMDWIRHARTGTTKQGKQINPDKYLPK
jgi:hypothetical protein